MADTILTLKELNSTFYTLTCQLLGLNPEDQASYNKVRTSWQKDSAPGWAITDDLFFLRITPIDNPYIKQRDVTYSGENKTTAYTRVHSVNWIVYGPNSFENAETLRNGLYGADLSSSNLYIVPDIPAPKRVPELFNGRWWERSDLSATYYERVIRQDSITTIQGVNIQIKTEEGVTKNVNITS